MRLPFLIYKDSRYNLNNLRYYTKSTCNVDEKQVPCIHMVFEDSNDIISIHAHCKELRKNIPNNTELDRIIDDEEFIDKAIEYLDRIVGAIHIGW